MTAGIPKKQSVWQHSKGIRFISNFAKYVKITRLKIVPTHRRHCDLINLHSSFRHPTLFCAPWYHPHNASWKIQITNFYSTCFFFSFVNSNRLKARFSDTSNYFLDSKLVLCTLLFTCFNRSNKMKLFCRATVDWNSKNFPKSICSLLFINVIFTYLFLTFPKTWTLLYFRKIHYLRNFGVSN
jgi:hypothetical protein